VKFSIRNLADEFSPYLLTASASREANGGCHARANTAFLRKGEGWRMEKMSV
jgi:hypothetical protein